MKFLTICATVITLFATQASLASTNQNQKVTKRSLASQETTHGKYSCSLLGDYRLVSEWLALTCNDSANYTVNVVYSNQFLVCCKK